MSLTITILIVCGFIVAAAATPHLVKLVLKYLVR